ncbi:MAG: hypothetical protein GX151_02415 [Gammaproteobacteria bacterium]|nr:hypothetical protein [Gammaproteobacteria bacterium]
MNASGINKTRAKKTAIIITVLKNTFGLTLSNQDVFLEGIIPPYFVVVEIKRKNETFHAE